MGSDLIHLYYSRRFNVAPVKLLLTKRPRRPLASYLSSFSRSYGSSLLTLRPNRPIVSEAE